MFPVNEQPADVAPDAAGGAWKGAGLALLVDDDPSVRRVGERLLQALGFEALVAEDGAVGVKTFREVADELQVVLLDLTMPNLGGEAAFKAMREIRSEVPVILMSGFNEQDTISRFVSDGLAGFLQKPFRLRDMSERIQAAIAGAKS
jgi:DNA-binding NtrC family response regulator